MDPVVEVEGLEVIGRDEAGREARIVSGVSFSIARGEVLALIGESGSGKSTIALALMGYARPGCRLSGGSIRIKGRDIATLSRTERQALRGRIVAYVAQSAAAAFNPARRIMAQVIEATRIHGTLGETEARAKAVALFGRLALPSPESIGERYPHQVSGGQLQRLMLAMALMTDPDIVVLDEPTTALDVTTQIEVLRAFKAAVRDQGTTALYVSHDLAVVAQMADRVVVLRRGEVQEAGPIAELIAAPKHPYTQSLLAAVEPAAGIAAVPRAAGAVVPAPLLDVREVSAGYGSIGADGMPALPVLRNVSIAIRPGSSVGVIGESGSGKSTLARVIAGLLPAAKGAIAFAGAPLPASVAGRTREQLRDIQIVFQMADTALNPAHTIGRILGRPARLYHGLAGAELDKRVAELLDMVRLPAHFAERRPGELSGGQRQRVALARALAARPRLVLCDEVTSGLDTVVGAAILKLLAELRRSLDLAYLFISHDLSTVRAVCDEVVILYAGERVEAASQAAFRAPPLHPYAELLLASVPELRVGWLDGLPARAETDAASALQRAGAAQGCAFVARCPLAIPNTCATRTPPERVTADGARIACHRMPDELLEAQTRTRDQAAAGRPH